MQDQKPQRAEEHPLYKPLMAAIHQAMFGKGERHGGAAVPFMDQPIFHYARMHGRGFLTGQAAKKLEEAASKRHGEPFVQEVLGAIVYAAAALLHEQQLVDADPAIKDRLTFEREWPWIAAARVSRDEAAWARFVERQAPSGKVTHGDRRDPHHHKVTFTSNQHPLKGHVRENCNACAESICDLCKVDTPHRRQGEHAPAPGPEVDEKVFRTGRCTCGAIDDFHSISCASLSVDRGRTAAVSRPAS